MKTVFKILKELQSKIIDGIKTVEQERRLDCVKALLALLREEQLLFTLVDERELGFSLMPYIEFVEKNESWADDHEPTKDIIQRSTLYANLKIQIQQNSKELEKPEAGPNYWFLLKALGMLGLGIGCFIGMLALIPISGPYAPLTAAAGILGTAACIAGSLTFFSDFVRSVPMSDLQPPQLGSCS